MAPKYGGDGDEEGEEEEEENMEDAQELLDGVKESMEQNAGDRARWPCSRRSSVCSRSFPQVNSTASLLCGLFYLSSSVCESFRFLPPCCQRLFVCYYNQKRNFIYNSMPPPQKSYH